MAPRKSTTRSARASRAAEAAPYPANKPAPEAEPAPSQPVASSSKLPDTPPLSVPESITWEYTPPARTPQPLTEEDKERLVHELLKFSPFNVLHDISEHARSAIYPIVSSVEGWARAMANSRKQQDREVDTGSHALETLLENQVDAAFDRFTAYALRNTFKVPDGVEIVMPWHRGIDFDRAKLVTELPGGEETLRLRLADLRAKVEQARLVRQKLVLAEAALDRRLEAAGRRRAEVGFVRDAVVDAGLAPLPDKVEAFVAALSELHGKLDGLDIPKHASIAPGGSWETGRQAYLSWAVGKALAGDTESGRLDAIEAAAAKVGTEADLEAVMQHK